MQSIIELLTSLDASKSGEFQVVFTRDESLAYLLEISAKYQKSTNEFFELRLGKDTKEYLSVCVYPPFMAQYYSVFIGLDHKLKYEDILKVLKEGKNTSGLVLIKEYKIFKGLKEKLKDSSIKFWSYFRVFKQDKLDLFKYFVKYTEDAFNYFENRIAWDTKSALNCIVELYNRGENVDIEVIRYYKPEVADIQTILRKLLEGNVKKGGTFMRMCYIACRDTGHGYLYSAVRRTIRDLVKFKIYELAGVLSSKAFYESQSDKLDELGFELNKSRYFKLIELGDLVTLKELSYIGQYFNTAYCTEAELLLKLGIIGTRKLGLGKATKYYKRKKGKRS